MNETEPLAIELRDAEETLKASLDEACGANVARADTGELIRVEEMLAIASDAAKRAISIRRKRRQRKLADAPSHRTLVDEAGVEWSVWAVRPTDRAGVKHARLLGTYEKGWLAFESDLGKRRLSPIPEDWELLDDAGLRSLFDRADRAPVRRSDEHPR